MDERRKLADLLEGVEGWLPLDDAWYLSEAARQCDHAVVEIGSYQGRSAIALGFGSTRSDKSVPVFAVEPHAEFKGVFGGSFGPADRKAYFENLLRSGMVEHVALVNLSSQVAAAGWEREIGLLFIDGDHRYEAVREDARLWAKHVVPGGLIVFDDTFIPDSGPLRVYNELLDSGGYSEVEMAGKLRSLRKL